MPTVLELAGIPIPVDVDGQSLVRLLRGDEMQIRPFLHGEHAPCYSQEQAYHFLTDGTMKYIWRPLDGSEQLFNLEDDPHELRDLSSAPGSASELESWRERLTRQLIHRPEGFVGSQGLVAGRPYRGTLPHARP